MNLLLAGIGKLISSTAGGNLATRLINRYTAHGIIIVVMQLETMGVLPQGVNKQIDGLPTADIALWISLAIGIYFVFHMPKFQTKLDKIRYKIELKKAELELQELEKQLQNK